MANETAVQETVLPAREAPDLGKDGALIGVCGVQGSGKSVFLTCVFQTIDMAAPSHGDLTFDRKEVGGARYFENLEEEIRSSGKVQGTRDRVRARLFLRVDDHSSKLFGRDLPIDLVDFAGRYFYLFADLGPSLDAGNLSDEERQEAHEISEILERCDGLIILISTALFRHDGGKPGDNPFPKSVTYLLDDCYRNQRPVALVFSQADASPQLTLAKIEEFDRVRRFRRQFTSTREEALKGERPYGIVELLSCYEIGPGGLPKLQNAEGSIWQPEASRVFLKILGAAWPRIRGRLEGRQQEREKERKLEQAARAVLAAERQKRKKRWAWGSLAVVALLALLTGGGFLGYRHFEQQKVVGVVRETTQLVRSGEGVDPERLARLQDAWLLRQTGSELGEVAGLGTAFDELLASLESAAETYEQSPSLDAKHEREIAGLRAIEGLIQGARPAWWSPELARKFEARASFLSRWNAPSNPDAQEDPASRINFLEEQKQVFAQLGDEPFGRLLTDTVTQQKRDHVESMCASALARGSTVKDRVLTIQSLLRDEKLPKDAEYRLLLRERLARGLVAAILELEENPKVRELLATYLPQVSSMPKGSLRLSLILPQIDPLQTAPAFSMEPFAELVRNRQFLVASALGDLIGGMSPQDRAKIWMEMIAELEKGYLFDVSTEVQVASVEPLPTRLTQLRASAPDSLQYQHYASTILLEQPFYYSELSAIEQRLASPQSDPWG